MKVLGAEVILTNNGQMLLVQQRKPQAYGLWSLPGGHVEEGETFEEAVRREVREELGVNLTAITPFKTNRIKTEGGRELELRTFIGAIDGDITLKQDELMAYGWFSLASLENMRDELRNPIVLTLAREALGAAKGEGKFR